MKIEQDYLRDEYNVTIDRKELHKAFESPQEFQKLLHNICEKTYGKHYADYLFPLRGDE